MEREEGQHPLLSPTQSSQSRMDALTKEHLDLWSDRGATDALLFIPGYGSALRICLHPFRQFHTVEESVGGTTRAIPHSAPAHPLSSDVHTHTHMEHRDQWSSNTNLLSVS